MSIPTVKRSEIFGSNGSNNKGGNTTTPTTHKVRPAKDVIMDVMKIHYEKQKSLILWGSSGFGKSATVKEFCKRENLKLIDIKAISLDPLTTALPEVQNGKVEFVPNTWFHEVCNSNQPICLFLDEINKFANANVQNMLNDIILDRQYAGHKIKDNVFIVSAANFVQESEQAIPLDVSILYRFTNILFSPTPSEIVDNMQSALGQTLARTLKPKGKGKTCFEEEVLSQLHEDIPRQIDHVAELCEGVLDRQVVEMISKGRIGSKAADKVTDIILKQALYVQELTPNTYDKVIKMYESGAKVEVQGLVSQCKDTDLACRLALALKSRVLVGTILSTFGNDVKMKDDKVFLVACVEAGITIG